ncbi:hypothetical protein [Staphylococcus epidermidis]|uniref:hypothetical protein n=1 Tax=Staphylococcus epidermidis TaxID=1282 RepID=UPI0011A9BA81|nr:hypothetical protein [Staphylococcus epidermidis]
MDELIRGILFSMNDDKGEGGFNLSGGIAEREKLFGYSLGGGMDKGDERWGGKLIVRGVVGEMCSVILDREKVV